MKKKGVLAVCLLIIFVSITFASATSVYWSKTAVTPGANISLIASLDSNPSNPVSFSIYEKGDSCNGNSDILASVQPMSGTAKSIETHNTNLFLLLPFNNQPEYGESNTFAYDFSGKQNNGVISGASYTAGKYGQALQFDGVSSYVKVNNNENLDPGTGDFTAELWFKPIGRLGGMQLINKQVLNPGWGIGVSWYPYPTPHYQLGWGASGFGATCTPSSPPTPDSWNHLAFVATYGNMPNGSYGRIAKLYLNGNYACMIPFASGGKLPDFIGSNSDLYLGRNENGDYFNGSIDNVIIYNRALSDAEITDDYNGKTIGLASVSTWQAENNNEPGCTPQYYFKANVDGQQFTSDLLTISSSCVDADGDGYYSASSGCPGGNDCNDNNAVINPGAREKCNGIDDNCDGIIDSENSDGCIFYYKDADQDGYGIDDKKCLCNPFGLYTSSNKLDCNDSRFLTNSGAIDYCGNGIDDNCDGYDVVCRIGGASWDSITASLGQNVGLNVKSPDINTQINFTIYEQGNRCNNNKDSLANVQPSNAFSAYSSGGEPQPEEDNSLYLKLNEGSGTTAIDSSGKQNNGVINDASYVDGKFGKALQFNGADSYVKITHNENLDPGTGDFTAELWFKPIGRLGGMQLINKQVSNPGWGIGVSWYPYPTPHYQLGWGASGFGATCTPSSPPTPDSWNHLAFVATYGNMPNGSYGRIAKLYLNGNYACMIPFASGGKLPDFIGSNSDLYLGRNENGDYFNGSIDNVIIYNRALSDAEITARYNSQIITAKSNWTVENKNEPGCTPQYYFIASLPGEPGQQVKSNLLTVDASGGPYCGDGIKNLQEVCDGTDLGGQTCIGLGFSGGSPSCLGDCSGFNTSRCTRDNSIINIVSAANFISISGNLSNNSISDLFKGNLNKINAIYSYSQGWKVYYPQHPELSTLFTVEPSKGYVVIANSPFMINITGKTNSNVGNINLKTGWNLIGTLSKDVSVAGLLGAGSIVYGYNSVYSQLGDSSILSNNRAYWVYSTSDKSVSPLS